MILIRMLRSSWGRDVSQSRPLFEGATYLAERMEAEDDRRPKALAILRDSVERGSELLVVWGEGYDDGQLFVAGRAGRDWVVVGTAERS